MIEYFLDWINTTLYYYPLAAPIVFIGVHVLLAAFFLPCSPMTLMAGALWGGMYGLVVSMCAAMVSSAATFLLSRSFLRSKIENFLVLRYPKIAELSAQAAVHDWKLLAISQVNPLIPSSTMGYVFGLSRITITRYLLFSGIFMLPLQTMLVMTGHSVTTLFTSDAHWDLALVLIFLVAIFLLISKLIYKRLCQLFGIKNGT